MMGVREHGAVCCGSPFSAAGSDVHCGGAAMELGGICEARCLQGVATCEIEVVQRLKAAGRETLGKGLWFLYYFVALSLPGERDGGGSGRRG